MLFTGRKWTLGTALLLALMLACGVCFAEGVSPTTGLETDRPYRPVLVEMSNSPESRPAWNPTEADVIYEMIYWGPAHTRYLALYNDEHPTQVGSVRGARVYGFEIMQAWDAVFAHYGGQDVVNTSIYDFMKAHEIERSFSIDGTRHMRGLYYREESRISPHNAMIDLDALVRKEWPTDMDSGVPYEPRPAGMVFGEKPTQGGREAKNINLRYDGDGIYQPYYEYDASKNGYKRFYDLKPFRSVDSAEQYVAQNVIVQENSEYFFENAMSRPVIVTTGGGRMRAYIDGYVTEGYWLRPTMEDPIRYYANDGTEITFRPGKTFVQMVPPHMYEAFAANTETYSNELWYFVP